MCKRGEKEKEGRQNREKQIFPKKKLKKNGRKNQRIT